MLPFSWRTKKSNLLIASYLFYAAWSPPFVILLWISTLVDWQVAKRLYVEERQSRRRLLLWISIAVNLGMLGYFKYGGFLMENFEALMAAIGVAYQAPEWNIVLPVGISFYTFQTMAYSLDVYMRRAAPAKSMLDFALFVTFFPQLVAGPIVRPTQLIPQFRLPRVATAQQLGWGLGLMTLGLFNKIVIADGMLSKAADTVFGAAGMLHPLDAWLGTLAFSGQIFCDFAGYSTTAIGAALCLGFSLPDNFRFPYAAVGFSDFWRRWHISLSAWLRDYLYIPLGGNRKGNLRTYANLLTTMLLGGLWHGAAWTFVVWGGLHGAFLAAERWLKARFGRGAVWKRWGPRLFLGRADLLPGQHHLGVFPRPGFWHCLAHDRHHADLQSGWGEGAADHRHHPGQRRDIGDAGGARVYASSIVARGGDGGAALAGRHHLGRDDVPDCDHPGAEQCLYLFPVLSRCQRPSRYSSARSRFSDAAAGWPCLSPYC